MATRSEEIRFEMPSGRKHYATMVVTKDKDGREALPIGTQLLELTRDEEQKLFVKLQ